MFILYDKLKTTQSVFITYKALHGNGHWAVGWIFCFCLPVDCRINGRLISLGEPVIGVARSSCETCFCINGQVRCDKVICPPIRAQISPNCGPVYSEGHCCPTSYNCTSNNGMSQCRIFPHTGSLTSH